MPTSMACDELACCRNCFCIWARLVLSGWNLIVRGTIFPSSAVPNNEQPCWVFHVLQWRVFHVHRLSDLEWSFLSMITTCDRSANIHVACSTFLVILLFQRESCILEQFVLQCLYFFVCSWWRKLTLMI